MTSILTSIAGGERAMGSRWHSRMRRWANEFGRMAVERLKKCDNILALSKELGIHRRLLYYPVAAAAVVIGVLILAFSEWQMRAFHPVGRPVWQRLAAMAVTAF
jgi:hypothetical protein